MSPPAEPLLYLLAPLGSFVLLFGSAFVLGDRVAAWLGLDYRDPAERLAVPVAIGLAALGLAGMGLGLAGGFRPLPILALQAVPILLLGARRRRHGETPAWEPAPRAGRWVRTGLYAVVAIFAVANLARALHPPTGFDALNYQLPAVARYLELGSLSFPADLRFAAGPALVPVLFVLAAAHGGDLAAQLVSFGMGLGAAAAVHALAGRAFGRTAGAAAMALFYATPIVGWLSAEAYVDLGLALFSVVALHAVVVRLGGGRLVWAGLAGVAAGAALGTRYLAAVPVAILAVDLASAPAVPSAAGGRRRAGALALFVALAGLTALPWYVRNAHESGNPIYPLFNERIGGQFWSPEDAGEHDAALRAIGPGRGLADLLALPVRLTFLPGSFGGSTASGIGYGYLLLMPLLLLVRRTRGPVRVLWFFSIAVTLAWFFSSQQIRFLLPCLAAFAALVGMAVGAIAERKVRLRPRQAGGILAVVFLAVVAGGTRWPSGLPPLGQTAREAYLEARVAGYATVERVKERLPDDAQLYAFGEEGRRYYFGPRTLGDWYGPAAYREFLPADDDRAVAARWRRLGVTHVLTRDDFPSRAIEAFRRRPYWWDRLVPLGHWGEVRLYRLIDPDAPGEAELPITGRARPGGEAPNRSSTAGTHG